MFCEECLYGCATHNQLVGKPPQCGGACAQRVKQCLVEGGALEEGAVEIDYQREQRDAVSRSGCSIVVVQQKCTRIPFRQLWLAYTIHHDAALERAERERERRLHKLRRQCQYL